MEISIHEFHINEFPENAILIYLKEGFHKRLFSEIKKYKFKEFNQKFFDSKLNYATFKNWKKRTTWLGSRFKKHFIPLWFIMKLSKIFAKFSIYSFEKNIVAYKGPSSSGIIMHPKLPLKEEGKLLKIVAHLLGDGHAGGGLGTMLPKGKSHSEYRNFSSELLDSFELDLRVFGKVPVTKDYNHGSVIFPNVISYILEHIYEIKFDTFRSRIPRRVFHLSKEITAQFVRAFFDDESHVFDSSIEVYSANPDLLTDTLNLINNKFPEIKLSSLKINQKAGKNIKYSFSIYRDSLQDYSRLFGFDNKQKRLDLLFDLKRIEEHNPHMSWSGNSNKNRIIELLKDKEMSAKELSRAIQIRHSSILDHLNVLREQGKVTVTKVREHGTRVWATVDS